MSNSKYHEKIRRRFIDRRNRGWTCDGFSADELEAAIPGYDWRNLPCLIIPGKFELHYMTLDEAEADNLGDAENETLIYSDGMTMATVIVRL